MSTKPLSRRRFLTVCASAGAYAALPVKALANLPLHRWNGILMGAQVSLSLAHPDRAEANRIFETSVKEIKRLENIFTLYDSHSELSQLNKNAALDFPSHEMVDILEQSYMYHEITGGAFDVTVKPLEEGKPLEFIGMNDLHISQKEIRFKKAGMGITLNGIAQGYITDRITELLKAEGLKNVLVELGEKRTIGTHPSNRPWLLKLQGKQEPVSLVDKALATSASRNGDTGQHHIFTPSNGRYAKSHNVVSVIANNATMADALSTGFLSLSRERINDIKKQQPSIFEVFIS